MRLGCSNTLLGIRNMSTTRMSKVKGLGYHYAFVNMRDNGTYSLGFIQSLDDRGLAKIRGLGYTFCYGSVGRISKNCSVALIITPGGVISPVIDIDACNVVTTDNPAGLAGVEICLAATKLKNYYRVLKDRDGSLKIHLTAPSASSFYFQYFAINRLCYDIDDKRLYYASLAHNTEVSLDRFYTYGKTCWIKTAELLNPDVSPFGYSREDIADLILRSCRSLIVASADRTVGRWTGYGKDGSYRVEKNDGKQIIRFTKGYANNPMALAILLCSQRIYFNAPLFGPEVCGYVNSSSDDISKDAVAFVERSFMANGDRAIAVPCSEEGMSDNCGFVFTSHTEPTFQDDSFYYVNDRDNRYLMVGKQLTKDDKEFLAKYEITEKDILSVFGVQAAKPKQNTVYADDLFCF